MDGSALWWLKQRRLGRLAVRQIRDDLAAAVSIPKFASWATFVFVSLWLFFRWLGAEKMISELQDFGVNFVAAAIAGGVMFLIVAATAPFRAQREEESRGTWFEGRFIYREPRLALATLWSPEDNGRRIDFTWLDAEPNSFVWYKVVIDGGSGRVRTRVSHRLDHCTVTAESHVSMTGGVRVNKRRELSLWAHSLPATDPVTIRVYITSFQIGNVEI